MLWSESKKILRDFKIGTHKNKTEFRTSMLSYFLLLCSKKRYLMIKK